MKFLNKYWLKIVSVVLILLVSWPLFKSGYFSHQDDLQVIRIFEMRQCFADFQIPCRWVPDMGWGNGFPLFNFYGVFTYYLGGLLSFIFGYIISAKILFFLALVLGSWGMYLLIKELWGKTPALVSSVLYLFAPYKALDIYVRGALSESMALTLIPFVFYFFYKLVKDPGSKKNFALSSIFLFIFLITHNIMTVIFVPVLISWCIYWLYVNKFKNFKFIILSFVFSIGLSAFFIFPAFFEKSLVQTESLTRFELDFRANYISLRQLFLDRNWGYGTSIPGPEGGMSFQIGVIHWLLAFASLLVIFSKKTKTKMKVLISGIFITFLLSIFMTHNKSTFVWENISIFQYFQFPWRFLSLSIFAASILGGAVVHYIKDPKQKYLAIAIVFFAVVLNCNYFKPKEFYDINDSQKLSEELWETQRKGAILDYLPKTALEPYEAAPRNPIVISGDVSISYFVNKSNSWSFDADVKENTRIETPVFYFPNWEVYVDGQKHSFDHDNLVGRISVNLEKGQHNVEGKFRNTPLRTVSNIISLVSLFGLIFYLKKYEKNKNNQN